MRYLLVIKQPGVGVLRPVCDTNEVPIMYEHRRVADVYATRLSNKYKNSYVFIMKAEAVIVNGINVD